MMNSVFYIVCYVVWLISRMCIGMPQCLDESGNPVDWYVLYKLPKLEYHKDERIASGTGYAFITSETTKQGWQYSNITIADSNSMPGRSLEFMFLSKYDNEVNDNFWLFYNDQPPGKPFTEYYGHTKGVVAGSKSGGIWIVHSVPKFPVVNGTKYEYPKTGTMYGQSFLCISLNQTTLNAVADQLVTNCAYVFNSSFTTELKSTYPSLVKASQNECGTLKTHKDILYSVGGSPFISFAKSKKFDADLYSGWVSDTLHCDLFVESWLHSDKIPSACNETYRVCNIQVVSMKKANCEFKNSHDHSKYAVAANSGDSFWVCIGDINRASSQFIRGGGTVCIDDKNLWTAYHGIISEVESCPKNLSSFNY